MKASNNLIVFTHPQRGVTSRTDCRYSFWHVLMTLVYINAYILRLLSTVWHSMATFSELSSLLYVGKRSQKKTSTTRE